MQKFSNYTTEDTEPRNNSVMVNVLQLFYTTEPRIDIFMVNVPLQLFYATELRNDSIMENVLLLYSCFIRQNLATTSLW